MAGMLYVRRGLIGLHVDFVFAHIRAYAIRPYTCSFIIVAEYGYSFPLFGDYRGMIGGKYGTKTVILQDDIFY